MMHHGLFSCPRLVDLWKDSGCEVLQNVDENLSMCDVLEKWQQVDAKVRIQTGFLLWCIWGERNNKVFNDHTSPNQIILKRVE